MTRNHSLYRQTEVVLHYFLGAVAGVFSIAVALYLGYLFNSEPKLSLEVYVQLLVFVVVALTLLWSIYVQKQKERFEESQVYLIKAVELIEKSYLILSNGSESVSTVRVNWVTAARLLARSESISSKIKLTSHQLLYESERDYQRHRFNDLLKINGNSLPLEFFFGDGYTTGKVGKSAYSTTSILGNNWIPTAVAIVIYRFSSFPPGYEDPLNEQRGLSKDEKNNLWLLSQQGFYNYIVFRDYFIPVGSKIFQVRDVSASKEVSEVEIDQKIPLISGLV